MVCRSCGGTNLVPVLDLGDQHLSDFRADDKKPPVFPLDLVYCTDCFLAQLTETVPRDLMYHDRYGFKSGVNDTIRADLSDVVAEALKVKPGTQRWLDIGCNDGTLLSNVSRDVYRVGFEPVNKLAAECRDRKYANVVFNDFFYDAAPLGSMFDVITSISMFYDLDDPNEFVAGVKSVLAPDGVWVVQQNYLAATCRLNAFDNIVHEHITYFSLLALRKLLDRHGLRVFRVSESTVNGGSFRTLICHADAAFKTEESVHRTVGAEIRQGLHRPDVLIAFGMRALRKARELADLVTDINGRGERVYIYGASTRGSTIWQTAGLDAHDLPFAVERNPEKVGQKIASIGVPIISEAQARHDNPEYMLVSPWFFRDEFVRRESEYLAGGGKFIFPLPSVEIVG